MLARKKKNAASYEGHAAGEDHEDDERLKVLVLDQLVHDEAPAAPDLARQCVPKRIHPRALADAVLRTAVVRVLQCRTSNQISELHSVIDCFTDNRLHSLRLALTALVVKRHLTTSHLHNNHL